MSDLSLNFDTGNKSVPINNITGNSSINLQHNMMADNSPKKIITGGPSLITSGDTGMSILANTPQPVSDNKNKVDMSPKSTRSEEFSFFKPHEDKGGIVDGDLPKTDMAREDSIFMNNETKELPGYKPIHRLSPQEIKNEN